MQQLLDEIRAAVHIAAKENKKAAMIHSLVLIHAAELEAVEPVEFCRHIGIPESYRTEFQKMLAAPRVLAGLGYAVQRLKVPNQGIKQNALAVFAYEVKVIRGRIIVLRHTQGGASLALG
jgi:hypothetical protein